MKQYYMETNGAQSGPFTLEELRIKGVTRETLVWSDGFEDWKAAGLAEDLQELFKTVPPPIKRTLPSGLSQSKLEDDKASFFSENKSKILLVSMIFLIVLVVIYSMGDKRKNEVEQRTNENTIVIEEQQKQLQEQQAKIA